MNDFRTISQQFKVLGDSQSYGILSRILLKMIPRINAFKGHGCNRDEDQPITAEFPHSFARVSVRSSAWTIPKTPSHDLIIN